MIIKEVHRADLVEEVENTSFKLTLPRELAEVSPLLTVDVSKNRTVMVYDYQAPDRYSDPSKLLNHFAAVIINKKTGAEINSGRHNFNHLWELKHWLVSLSAQLNIKKRRRTETEETSDED